ncbi:YeeE/YedE thiosulfate transporter family protein [Ferrovibrio xuzhouensis]|uniref:YeeE/YedE thiosulfate transporter family protein n=1 Tax=Ferrovibrio xuzhouensis TaxID=1576914 RepID=A0ABV7VAF6_9PROT
MDLSFLTERLIALAGETGAAALGGLAIGMVFGIAAQQSRFCLRAATVEFGRDCLKAGLRPGGIGPRSSVWLLTFGTALFWTQALRVAGLLDLSEARMLAVPGSISGALIGGLMFGCGMVLARGCSGRMLVLAATGNLRSLLSGLVFAVTAQMSLHGLLAPLRATIAGWWTTASYTGGRNIEIAAWLGLGDSAGLALGLLAAITALIFAIRNRVGIRVLVMASGVGFAIPLAWVFTTALSQASFDPVTIEAITFTGPSAELLMAVLEPARRPDFQTGLVPGVFLGAFLAALVTRELKLQGFEGAASMRRYLLGAALMGMGGMLAGGCAIGAGVSGTSVLSLTAWIALAAMWAGAMATDALVDAPAAAIAMPS